MTRIGEDESFATYILATVSDYVPAGEERRDRYAYLVAELYALDLDEPLYDLAEDPYDDDLAYVLTREGYADKPDDDDSEEE